MGRNGKRRCAIACLPIRIGHGMQPHAVATLQRRNIGRHAGLSITRNDIAVCDANGLTSHQGPFEQRDPEQQRQRFKATVCISLQTLAAAGG